MFGARLNRNLTFGLLPLGCQHRRVSVPRAVVILLSFGLLVAGQPVTLAMGGGGAGTGSHGGMKPGGGGGTYNIPPERRAHVHPTPRAMLDKRKNSPRS